MSEMYSFDYHYKVKVFKHWISQKKEYIKLIKEKQNENYFSVFLELKENSFFSWKKLWKVLVAGLKNKNGRTVPKAKLGDTTIAHNKGPLDDVWTALHAPSSARDFDRKLPFWSTW